MMVTLFAYAYAVGERSSRGIERRCREDVAFRVICANQAPDHATIARFRVRHEEALAELFGTTRCGSLSSRTAANTSPIFNAVCSLAQ
jgi:transposase